MKNKLSLTAVTLAGIALGSLILFGWQWQSQAALVLQKTNLTVTATNTKVMTFAVKPEILSDLKTFNNTFKFNMTALQRSFRSCSNQATLCEREYRRCKGLLDWSDQQGAEVLFKLKNACISQCAEPAGCFGLNVSGGQIEGLKPVAPVAVAPTVEDVTDSSAVAEVAPQTKTPIVVEEPVIITQVEEVPTPVVSPEVIPVTKNIIEDKNIQIETVISPTAPVEPMFQFYTCDGTGVRSCTEGLMTGIQQGTCNVLTGEWVWGDCLGI